MQRRKFIFDSALTVSGSLAFSPLLGSCKKENALPVDWDGKVAIIGGGAAGMYAAEKLRALDISYTILEAGSSLGGRVKTLKGFGDADIELGAEFVHGKRTDFYQIVKDEGGDFVNVEDTESGRFLLDGQLVTEDDAADDADIQKVYEFVDEVTDYDGGDISMEQYVDQFPSDFPQRTRAILNAVSANSAGTSLSRLGMKTLALEEDLWTAGNKDYLVPNKSYIDIFQSAYSTALTSDKIKYNWAVQSIDYSGERVKITNTNGQTETFDKVIITVPLKVLQDGDISFTPALPSAKTSAFDKIGMDAGMKILLKFDSAFWGNDFGGIIGGALVPEYWTPIGTSRVLTAFVMGEAAEYLSGEGNNAVNQVLAELDSMFGGQAASNAFADSHIEDWTKNPYVKGAYSYPKPGMGDARQTIASSVQGKLFFAGEATHTQGHSSTVHGAMETGGRAVAEIYESIFAEEE